ncbi:Os07g0551933 [Oryza sativa Japonica Group]|uniref:Os07g0551933 protein n=1 Tax=Oryza sativa subsp. japonica TaxID=39947 RepID=A0A0P0X7D7_ORYSJ|nr:Os07g0551933 [Oryza sativa Japonica Group]
MSVATAAASRHRSCCRRRYRQSPSSAIAAASCCRHRHHQLSPSPAAAAVTAATTSRRPDPAELARIWGISLLSPPSPAPLCLAAPHGLPPLLTVPMMASDTVTAAVSAPARARQPLPLLGRPRRCRCRPGRRRIPPSHTTPAGGSTRSGQGRAGSVLGSARTGHRRRRLTPVVRSHRRPSRLDHERGRWKAPPLPSLPSPGFAGGCSGGGEAGESRGREGAARLESPPASPLGWSDRGLCV